MPCPRVAVLAGSCYIHWMAEAAERTKRVPDTIYHIAERTALSVADTQPYSPRSLAREGFVHASSWAQLRGVASSLFRGRTDVTVLEIDALLLPEPPVWEDLYGLGQTYPHVYSAIPRDVIVAELAISWDSTGSPVFTLAGAPGPAAAPAPSPGQGTTAAPVLDISDETIELLAWMNSQLIEDEGHDNRMGRAELASRMRGFLEAGYTPWIFRLRDLIAGYALVNDAGSPTMIRHFFVRRGLRRRGVGRAALAALQRTAGSSLSVEVLSHNSPAMRFWHTAGFTDRSICMRAFPPHRVETQDHRGSRSEGSQADSAAGFEMERISGDARNARRFLDENIKRYNDTVSPYHRAARDAGASVPLAIMLADSSGAWKGGVCGRIHWAWLVVDDLWLAPEARGSGYGSALLREIEAMAVSRGATHSRLSTFSFQAPGFYQRHGYSVVGEIAEYPPGESLYWMRKELGADTTASAGRQRT